jgi:hypothetical protein
VNASTIDGSIATGVHGIFQPSGVKLENGGTVINQSGGVIGSLYGVAIQGGSGTVVNYGSVSGTKDSVKFAAGYANRLIVDPGATFSGTVDGGNAPDSTIVSTLELASGASAGTVNGSHYVDFDQIAVDAGAGWTLAGANTIGAYGVMEVYGNVTNIGSLTNTRIMADNGVFFTAVVLYAGASLTNAAGGR